MSGSKILTTVIVILIAGLLLSSTLAGYYLLQYQQAQNDANHYLAELDQSRSSLPLTTNILLDFGNGTHVWYNDTVVQPGWNLYLATVDVTRGNMNATWYPSYGEHLVTAIDGVQDTANETWFIWTYNSTMSWQVSASGADQLQTFSGTVFAWSYCGLTPSYAPTCAKP